jgi:hypothetical protein
VFAAEIKVLVAVALADGTQGWVRGFKNWNTARFEMKLTFETSFSLPHQDRNECSRRRRFIFFLGLACHLRPRNR